jgi:hypothetical protein
LAPFPFTLHSPPHHFTARKSTYVLCERSPILFASASTLH